MQFVNVKIILYGVTSISTFVLPYTQNIYWILATSLLLAFIALVSNLAWAVAGKLLQLRISVIAIARFRCFSSKLSLFLHIYNILGDFVLWI
nr:hypothetical protein [Vibrio kanaloae]